METSNPGFFKRYGLILFLLLLLVVAVSAVLLLSNTAKNKPMQTTQSMISPTSAPLTTQNAEPTLTQMDQNIQTTMNQVDSDLKDVNNIDTTQDSTTGL